MYYIHTIITKHINRYYIDIYMVFPSSFWAGLTRRRYWPHAACLRLADGFRGFSDATAAGDPTGGARADATSETRWGSVELSLERKWGQIKLYT